jgi:hypothetical protein
MTTRHNWNTGELAELVRPYALTGGRTAPRAPLQPSGLALTTEDGRPDRHPLPELRGILGFCATPQAVADIAAGLGLPLGVVEVLVCDLAEQGALTLLLPPPDRSR